MATDVSFGEWLKQRRKQLDLTQQELADAAGCSVGTIRKVERDARRPSKQLAEIMAKVLELPEAQWEAFVTFARTEAYTADLSTELEQLAETIAPSLLEIPTIPGAEPRPPAESEPPPKPESMIPIRNNLPAQPTPFIGREAELTALDDLLANETNRLITIVGPGGMGKTRLAVAYGEMIVFGRGDTRVAPDNGLYFVPLAPLSDSEYIPTAMAEAFGLPLESGGQQRRTPKQQVIDYLREKQLLLILDNFEHLLEGASLVNEVLEAAPEVKIIVTSRERLHLRSEQLYLIEGLEFPDWETPEDAAEYTAVRLFIQSAKRVQHDFALAAADLTYLSRICRLVSGMPLAVELAAGWVDLLPLEEIAAELQQSPDFLETEVRDVPERHRSMRAVFDASWQQMPADEQAIFPQLSVFRGGFTRKAGQAITGANLRTLGRLVSKSLLQYDRERDRYQIHELLRQYAAEKLNDDSERETAVRDQHSAYYCQALHQRLDDLKGGRQREALHEIESDLENARVAWRWAAEHQQVEWLSQAIDSLGYFHEWTGRYQEGYVLLADAWSELKGIDTLPAVRTRIRQLGWQGFFSTFVETRETGVDFCQAGLALLAKPALNESRTLEEKAFTLYQLGRVGSNQDHRKNALEKSLNICQDINNQWGIANTLQILGEPDQFYKSAIECEVLLEDCLAIRRSLGDKRGVIHTLIQQSTLFRYQGKFNQAQQLAYQALKLCQESDSRTLIARGFHNLGMSTLHSGEFENANTYFLNSIKIYQDLGDPFWLSNSYHGHGMTYLALGQLEQAREQGQKITKISSQGFYFYNLISGAVYLSEQRHDRASLSFHQELLSSQKIAYEYWISTSFAWIAIAEQSHSQVLKARSFAHKALQSASQRRNFMLMQIVYVAILLMFSKGGDLERAIELDSLAREKHPWLDKAWFWIQIRRPFNDRIAHLPPEVVEAARKRGRQLDYWQTAEALLEELTEKGWGEGNVADSDATQPLITTSYSAQANSYKYQLQDELGTGAFGTVYRAVQAGVGREVAVKVIRPEYASQPDFVRRFEQEAQFVAQLEHPHIVPLYDYWHTAEGAYLVMRLLRGGSLQDKLRAGPLPLPEVTRIFDQITAALHTAHQRTIVHRDIKTANILLDETGNAYLSDFGIAKDLQAAADLTQVGAMVGSPAYMSPEQISNEPLTPQADIYSLGVVLYELLTSRLPFETNSFALLIQHHLHDPLPLLPESLEAVNDVIQQATAKRPEDRFSDVLAMAAALRTIHKTK